MLGMVVWRSFLLAVWSLWRREVIRFLRQRSRVIGALGTPVVFWFLIGSGLGSSFRPVGESGPSGYLEYAFPGTIVLIVLFTAIFATISIIEDRQAGFLQGVLVAPVGRSAIVLGKVLGSTTLAVVQAMLFFMLAPLAGVPLSFESAVSVFGVLLVVGVGLSALGFLIAWRLDSTQGFHAVMNLFLIPMWLLSGAFFPATGASGWLRWMMALNPLTYGVSALKHAIYLRSDRFAHSLPSVPLSIAVTVGFALVMVMLAARATARRS